MTIARVAQLVHRSLSGPHSVTPRRDRAPLGIVHGELLSLPSNVEFLTPAPLSHSPMAYMAVPLPTTVTEVTHTSIEPMMTVIELQQWIIFCITLLCYSFGAVILLYHHQKAVKGWLARQLLLSLMLYAACFWVSALIPPLTMELCSWLRTLFPLGMTQVMLGRLPDAVVMTVLAHLATIPLTIPFIRRYVVGPIFVILGRVCALFVPEPETTKGKATPSANTSWFRRRLDLVFPFQCERSCLLG